MQPRVSVLTTIYNREAYLAEALDSILEQSFSDWELILVDDCSTDRSPEIAQGYLTDPRIRYYRNERNLGDYPNRNAAAAFARGKYLKYVDSDDRILPHCLETMVAMMEAHPEAALGLCKSSRDFPELPKELTSLEAYRRNFLCQGIFANAPLSTIIRRESFEAVGGFSGRQYIGDSELWLRLAAEYPVVLLPSGLTWWRRHEDQQSTHGWGSGLQSIEEFHKDMRAIQAPHCPLPEAERERAAARVRGVNIWAILRAMSRGRFGFARKQAKAMGLSLWDFLRFLCRWIPFRIRRKLTGRDPQFFAPPPSP